MLKKWKRIVFGLVVLVLIRALIFALRDMDFTKICQICYGGKQDIKHDILLVVSLNSTFKGREKFSASVLIHYLNTETKDLVLVASKNEYTDTDTTLRSLYGNDVIIYNSLQGVLEVFMNSSHKILLHINSNMILHNSWKQFVRDKVKNTSESFYWISGTNVNSSADRGHDGEIVIGTESAKTLIRRYNAGTVSSTLINQTGKVPIIRNFPFLYLGRPDSDHKCASTDSSLEPCDYPPWVKDGIQFFHKNCYDINAEYIAKDLLPRTRPGGDIRIAILLSRTSATNSKLFMESLTKTTEESFKYVVYTAADGSSDRQQLEINLPDNVRLKLSSAQEGIYIDDTNLMYRRAYEEKMDYFVQTQDLFLFRNRGWTSNAIELMKAKRPANVGVVQTTCSTCRRRDCVNFVSRLHFDIFGTFFLEGISQNESCEWIYEVYKADPEWLIETAEVRKTPYHDKILKSRKLLQDWSSPIISFSLYGSSPQYTDGAIANMKLRAENFPEWQMWVYHDDTVPRSVLKVLCQNGVKLINMSKYPLKNKMTWRFLVASEPMHRFIVRDADSRLTKRDRSAVTEWVASGKKFHIIRDCIYHVAYPVNGGLWGGTLDAFPDMRKYLEQKNPGTKYVADMNFLTDVVWNEMQKSALQHDSTNSSIYGRTVPFPFPKEAKEFVGQRYFNGVGQNDEVCF